MNRERWPDISPKPNPEEIRSYLTDRMAFLETYLENPEAYVTVHAWIPGNIWFWWALLPGECLEKPDDDQQYLWYDLATDMPFDFDTPVFRNTTIQKRLLTQTD